MRALKFIVITGYSGSGKSTALAALEDSGFYCVDNMPVALLPKFLKLPIEKDFEAKGFAFVMDLREKGFLPLFTKTVTTLKSQGYHFKIIFIEADKKRLLQRYSQTRRHHPLSKSNNVMDGITKETVLLKDIRETADKIIDTTHYTVHELKAIIQDIAKKGHIFIPMGIQILSFGFKYGVPQEADLVIDVRFLANPYFLPELRKLDGKASAVEAFVLDGEQTCLFLKKYLDLLAFLIPLYEKEGKAYLTLAVGCTGGRHRSVTIAEYIHDRIRDQKRPISVRHRDIDRL